MAHIVLDIPVFFAIIRVFKLYIG